MKRIIMQNQVNLNSIILLKKYIIVSTQKYLRQIQLLIFDYKIYLLEMFLFSPNPASINSIQLLQQVEAGYSPIKSQHQPHKAFKSQAYQPKHKNIDSYSPLKMPSKKLSGLSIQECQNLINKSMSMLNSSHIDMSQQQLNDIRLQLNKYSQMSPEQQQSFGQKQHEIQSIFQRLQDIITEVQHKISLSASKREKQTNLKNHTLSFQKVLNINVESSQQLPKIAPPSQILSASNKKFHQQAQPKLEKNISCAQISQKSNKFISMTLVSHSRNQNNIPSSQIFLSKRKNKGINVYSVEKLKKPQVINQSSSKKSQINQKIRGGQYPIKKQEQLRKALKKSVQPKTSDIIEYVGIVSETQKIEPNDKDESIKKLLPLKTFQNVLQQHSTEKINAIKQNFQKDQSSNICQSRRIKSSRVATKGKTKTKEKPQKNLKGQLISYKLKNPTNFYNMKRVSNMRMQ